MEPQTTPANHQEGQAVHLVRALGLWNLIVIGMVVIQPTAPMGIYGVISNKGHGHVVTTILIAMVAMLFTAYAYGSMARVYPSAGSAYTYVGHEIHPGLGYVVGWGMVMDYLLNPLICTAFCAKAAMNIVPGLSYYVWILIFAAFFTWTNLRGVKTSARLNESLCAAMSLVVLLFLVAVGRAVYGMHHPVGFFRLPFYDPRTFSLSGIFAGTSVSVLSYIGFDAVSTLSEETRDPRRNIMRATMLICILAGVISAVEVYAAQLIWGSAPFPSNQVESAFALVARKAGGEVLFQIINFTLLIANMGSAMGAQLAAGRLLYGMGRGGALPARFFASLDSKNHVPRNNVLLIGCIALFGAGILEYFSARLGGGAYETGAQALNFGALISFMGVNAASGVHAWRTGRFRQWFVVLSAALGFLICGFLWLNLSKPAFIVGAVWMAAGISYGAFRTRGFRSALATFNVPAEDLES